MLVSLRSFGLIEMKAEELIVTYQIVDSLSKLFCCQTSSLLNQSWVLFLIII